VAAEPVQRPDPGSLAVENPWAPPPGVGTDVRAWLMRWRKLNLPQEPDSHPFAWYANGRSGLLASCSGGAVCELWPIGSAVHRFLTCGIAYLSAYGPRRGYGFNVLTSLALPHNIRHLCDQNQKDCRAYKGVGKQATS
jgi:hypothetical protein